MRTARRLVRAARRLVRAARRLVRAARRLVRAARRLSSGTVLGSLFADTHLLLTYYSRAYYYKTTGINFGLTNIGELQR